MMPAIISCGMGLPILTLTRAKAKAPVHLSRCRLYFADGHLLIAFLVEGKTEEHQHHLIGRSFF